jgi:hypothetical protein
MQTFMPYADFTLSTKCLDWRRLGKQRIECKQILRALGVQVGDKPLKISGWRNHPAVRMWRGYEEELLWCAMTVCMEWKNRDYKDSLMMQFWEAHKAGAGASTKMPPWFGDSAFHDSHKSNLIRKKPEHYGPMWPDVPPDLPYIWPV